MIKLSNVSKSFGNNLVLDNFNLEINKSAIFGLVGINGAGKSTLLRIIAGVYQSDKGAITISGDDIKDETKTKKKIFFLPDEPYYEFNLKGIDLLNLYKSYYEINMDKLNNHLTKLKLDLNKPIHNFSKGMKRQLFLSIAISLEPDYLLLDEAFDGFDPLTRLYFKRSLVELVNNKGTTVIISSHALRELEDICDSFGIIDNNTILFSGDLNEYLATTYKYQVVVENFINEEMIKSINIIKYETEGNIIKITFKGKEEAFLNEIDKYSPIFVDKLPVSFEDVFIEHVESRGYIKWHTLNIIIKKY